MKKILLADDSITIQKVVELTFSDGDYEVVCVSNGAQALKRLQEFHPDIVLLDVVMPEKNGYEVCEQIRRDPATAAIPVLLLTGTFEPFDQKRADAVGASGHLTKPFESHSLVALVDELVSMTPPAPAGEIAAAPPPPAGPGMVRPAGAGIQERAPSWEEPAAPAPYFAGHEPGADATPTRPPAPIPDPTDGGSYRGADHLGLDEAPPEIIPDRFDEQDPALTTTLRVNRGDFLPGAPAREAPPADPDDRADMPAAPMEGFVAGYGFPEGAATAGPLAGAAVPAAGDAEPFAAPVPDQDLSAAPAEERHAPVFAPGEPAAALTPQDIDRIAEQVVARMSDRVVREIAWEVIPQVAEAIVRSRIRELEEQGDA